MFTFSFPSEPATLTFCFGISLVVACILILCFRPIAEKRDSVRGTRGIQTSIYTYEFSDRQVALSELP